MAEYIIFFCILCFAALLMIGIGISQLRSKDPVGFYTGVPPLKAGQLRDVEAWNKKHGRMWVIYGFAIMGCGFASVLAGVLGCGSVLLTIAECAVIIGGIFVMMWYHIRLEKMYRI